MYTDIWAHPRKIWFRDERRNQVYIFCVSWCAWHWFMWGGNSPLSDLIGQEEQTLHKQLQYRILGVPSEGVKGREVAQRRKCLTLFWGWGRQLLGRLPGVDYTKSWILKVGIKHILDREVRTSCANGTEAWNNMECSGNHKSLDNPRAENRSRWGWKSGSGQKFNTAWNSKTANWVSIKVNTKNG